MDNAIESIVLNAASAEGELLVLDQPLSFWGGFDPTNGKILDTSHPQHGQSVTGKVLALESSKGSSGTPAGICESIRNGSGPKAILLCEPDVNIATGAMVAESLYGKTIPVLQISKDAFRTLRSGTPMSIARDGGIEVR